MAGYNFSDLCTLVVDDYDFMRNLLQQVLNEFGFREVLEANDGDIAVEMLRKHAVDVVFLDWNMPNLDGLTFTRGVRQGEYGSDPYLPILMVSGHTTESRVRRALDAGVHSYVLKPITPHSIAARLSQLIEQPPRFVKTDTYFGPYRQPREMAAETVADWPTAL